MDSGLLHGSVGHRTGDAVGCKPADMDDDDDDDE